MTRTKTEKDMRGALGTGLDSKVCRSATGIGRVWQSGVPPTVEAETGFGGFQS